MGDGSLTKTPKVTSRMPVSALSAECRFKEIILRTTWLPSTFRFLCWRLNTSIEVIKRISPYYSDWTETTYVVSQVTLLTLTFIRWSVTVNSEKKNILDKDFLRCQAYLWRFISLTSLKCLAQWRLRSTSEFPASYSEANNCEQSLACLEMIIFNL